MANEQLQVLITLILSLHNLNNEHENIPLQRLTHFKPYTGGSGDASIKFRKPFSMKACWEKVCKHFFVQIELKTTKKQNDNYKNSLTSPKSFFIGYDFKLNGASTSARLWLHCPSQNMDYLAKRAHTSKSVTKCQ